MNSISMLYTRNIKELLTIVCNMLVTYSKQKGSGGIWI